MTVAEQAALFSERKAGLLKTVRDLMKTSAEELRTLTPAEAEIYDAAVRDIAMIDAHIPRLQKYGVEP